MTPKETAEELVKNFSFHARSPEKLHSTYCAIITSEKIISELKQWKSTQEYSWREAYYHNLKFWQEVLNHLKSMQ